MSPLARSLAILKVLGGQLHLAAFVAQLVSAMGAAQGRRATPDRSGRRGG